MSNLGDAFAKIFHALVGGSNPDEAHATGEWNTEASPDFSAIGNFFSNWFRKISGSGLTDAEREANQWTASREDLAWQRQMDAANTAHQRDVADLQAAGLNPMLALGRGGVSTPSYSSNGSVSPGSADLNLSALLSFIMLPSQLKNMKAEREVMAANAENIRAKTSETQAHLDWFNQTRELEFQGLEQARALDDKRIAEINQSIEESKARVERELASANESNERANLAIEQAVLARANADNITFMQPFIAHATEAAAGKDEAAANLALVDAAYRQGLIDYGAIAASVRAMNAGASKDEIDTEVANFEKVIKSKDASSTPDPNSKNIAERLAAAIRIASRTIQGK